MSASCGSYGTNGTGSYWTRRIFGSRIIPTGTMIVRKTSRAMICTCLHSAISPLADQLPLVARGLSRGLPCVRTRSISVWTTMYSGAL